MFSQTELNYAWQLPPILRFARGHVSKGFKTCDNGPTITFAFRTTYQIDLCYFNFVLK